MSDFAAAALAWLASALARLGDAAPVLAGGAGGAILVWWLDGRRVARRERRQVIGAAELIGLELAANVSSLEIWLASSGHAPPP